MVMVMVMVMVMDMMRVDDYYYIHLYEKVNDLKKMEKNMISD